jgi:4'-phosphopantetheinyl transferase
VNDRSADRVQLWWAAVDDAAYSIALPLLPDDETRRAKKFMSDESRARFVVSRGLVRGVLGHQLGVAPAAVSLCAEPDEKPVLSETADSALQFNLSHSGFVTVVATHPSRAIGVDVEALDARVDIHAIARRQFSERECGLLAEAGEKHEGAMFFDLWVRKEAVIKAVGSGFRIDTRLLDVGLDAGTTADGRTWTIRPFDVTEGYAAAVAVEARTESVDVPSAASLWDLTATRPG